MLSVETVQHLGIPKMCCRLANDANIVLPHGECCATRKDFHVECANCGVCYCSESCMEDAYNAWHKTLCLRSREPDPTHPLVNLVSELIFLRNHHRLTVTV